MALSEFRQIPGVGSDMEAHLMSLGLTNLAELAKENPEELYTRDCLQFGQPLDKCILYIFRCAVYYARTPEDRRDPEKLKWWYWKDHRLDEEEQA